jgi:hypothetical protein
MYRSLIRRSSRKTNNWPVAGHPWGCVLPVDWRVTDAYELLASRKAEYVTSAVPKDTSPEFAKRGKTYKRRATMAKPSRREKYPHIRVVCLEVPGCTLRRRSSAQFKREHIPVAIPVPIKTGLTRDKKPSMKNHLVATTHARTEWKICPMVRTG